MRDLDESQAHAAVTRWYRMWKQTLISHSQASWEFSGKDFFAMRTFGYVTAGLLPASYYVTDAGKAAAEEER